MICENKRCGKEHDGSFGSGRFCSKSCANSRSWTEIDKKKKSISAKNSDKVKSANLTPRRRVRTKGLNPFTKEETAKAHATIKKNRDKKRAKLLAERKFRSEGKVVKPQVL